MPLSRPTQDGPKQGVFRRLEVSLATYPFSQKKKPYITSVLGLRRPVPSGVPRVASQAPTGTFRRERKGGVL
jgi:hypothetical protein